MTSRLGLIVISVFLLSCRDIGEQFSSSEAEVGATGTVLHVSPSGAGSACSTAAPCSLVDARDKVRTLNSNMQDDIAVNLADGIYTLSAPFTLRETAATHDSGSNGHNIIYQAEPGARPILSGGTRITGWTLWNPAKNIYRASGTSGLQARQLYVNGVRATRARGEIDPAKNRVDLASGFRVADASLANWNNRNQMEIVSEEVWKSNRCPVASINQVWHNVVAQSNGHAFDLGNWFDSDRLTNAGQGTTYHVGDFNGDGKSDLLFAYLDPSGHWHNQVALSDGNSFVFTSPADWLTDAGKGTNYQVGDFNKDGKSDLLFAYLDGSGHWRNEVALSTGSGFSFTSPANWLPDAGQNTAYYVGDYDGDRRSDVLFAYLDNSGHWRNEVALSTGSGFSFASPANWLPDAGQNTEYHVGDYNGDHKSDLLFAYLDNSGHWRNEVALSTGSGFSFASPANWLPDVGQGTKYHVGDYNGDGSSDLLFTYQDAAGTWHNAVALSTRTGFAPPTEWLPNVGQDVVVDVGNFLGDANDRTTDVLFAGYDALIAAQEPCWTDAHSQGEHAGMPPAPGAGFNMNTLSWLENALELLDEPGEWYLDGSAGYVYYRPRPLEDLATAPVVAATLETLIDGQGEVSPSETRFLHNIQFRNLTFAYAGWFAPNTSAGYPDIQAGWHGPFTGPTAFNPTRTPGNVTFSIASALRFEGNIFTHLGAVGLNLDSGSQDNAIVGNVFRDISSTAIQIGDVSEVSRWTTDSTKQARNNTIADNYITDVAAEYHDAVGLLLGYHNGAAITHNELVNLPYSGISIGWGWGEYPDGMPTGCNDSFAGSNVVTGNRIHDVMLSRIDGGGIYTLSGQLGSATYANFITGNTHTVGLYHDSGTCGYGDQWNVVAGAAEWMSMWEEATVLNNQITYNYADVDNATCGTTGLSEQLCNPTPSGGGSQNYVHFNTFTGGVWPAAAQDIMNQAGLEPAYLGIKSPVCGDATCNAGETASSCPKDCL